METSKKGKARKGCLITLVIGILVIVVIGILLQFISKNMKSYDGFDFTALDLSVIEDGTYTGSENAGLVKVTVDVIVKDHTIQNVTIVKHDCGKGKPAEIIVDDIVQKNSLDVDAISGATLSSNAIKVAVYNALTNTGN